MQTEVISQALKEFKNTLSFLDNNEFSRPIRGLSGGTIGQHTRHIIELFQCLMNGYDACEVNYDKRERDLLIQTDIEVAQKCISGIIERLSFDNKSLVLVYELKGMEDKIATNFNRELLYNFEHCIHHQALIKVGLLELGKTFMDDGFGVAASTLKFREKCAQ